MMDKGIQYDGKQCVCNRCGLSQPHRTGFPCFREICPNCNIPLMRVMGDYAETDRGQHAEPTPEIDRQRCIACGICLDVCPVDAIHFREGKAWIDPKRCTFCGICTDHCPQSAIPKIVYSKKA